MGWIVPFTYIGVGISRVDKLILLKDVLSPVVLEVLDVEDLGVRIVEHTHDLGVFGVGDIDNVHVVPTCQVRIGPTVWCCSDLDFCIPGCAKWIEIKEFHVVSSCDVLTGVLVIVSFSLEQRVTTGNEGLVHRSGLGIVTKKQQRR